jgi:hypothetical protein
MPSDTTYKIYINVSSSDLQSLIAKAPVVVLFNADQGFDSYKSGVYSCASATTISNLNHAVELIGYD